MKRVKRIIINYVVICTVAGMMYSCNSIDEDSEDTISKEPIHFKSPNATYHRDSLFIATTVRQFMDKEVDIFDFYKQYHIPLDRVQVNVDSILYSPDSLKLFSFVIMIVPDYENDKPDSIYYNGYDLIGYRDSKKDIWAIWYFGQYCPSGWDNYNKVRNLFRNYYIYHDRFKNGSNYYWSSKKQDYVSIPFGYNIDDKHFWDSSVVWQKEMPIPGYYPFQVKDQSKPEDKDAVKVIPHLDYPDSLLKLYR